MIDDLSKRLKKCILGNFKFFEVTEIVAFNEKYKNKPDPINVYSIWVAEENDVFKNNIKNIINDKRIRIKGLKGWFFGVFQYNIFIYEVFDKLKNIKNRSHFLELKTSELTPICPQFIPADSSEKIPLNKILKNNFNSGSHVLELFDTSKELLQPLLENPRILKELSEIIYNYIPIQIGSMSDRLGNIIIQIPVHSIMLDNRGTETGCCISIHWCPNIIPRECILYVEENNDHVIDYANFNKVCNKTIFSKFHENTDNISSVVLFDIENNLILAAYASINIIRRFSCHASVVEHEHRIIVTKNKNDEIVINTLADDKVIGKEYSPEKKFIKHRIYEEEKKLLQDRLEFKQYGLESKLPDQKKHQLAIEDIRTLINRHGQNGVWLWDPYLDAEDIMETLFYCKFFGVELRALAQHKNNDSWIQKQRETFNFPGNNHYGLKCEFKIAFNGICLNFHDRFLLFPRLLEPELPKNYHSTASQWCSPA